MQGYSKQKIKKDINFFAFFLLYFQFEKTYLPTLNIN